MTSFGFDVGNTAPSTGSLPPLPPGWYAMRIVRAEAATSEKPGAGGSYIKMEFEIIDHLHVEFAGRKAFVNFFHLHDNKQTREIARGQIAAICQAVGKRDATTTDDVLGGELLVQLKVVPPSQDGRYDAKNEPRGFKPMDGAPAPAASAPASSPKPAAAPAANTKQPWKR